MSGKIKVLITGATGFAGRHLVRALEEEGPSEFEIFGAVYPDTPSAPESRLIFLDLRSGREVARVVGEVRPDWVFHLAAVSSVRNSWQMRTETMETNVLGTHNLLEAVRVGAPGARVLFVSSADVYGNSASQGEGLREDAPFDILSPYACSKAAGEMLCRYYGKVENIDIVIARPFPHTGPGQSADFVCSDWARQIARIEKGDIAPVLKVGNLELRRDFCDVRDVVRAYVLLMRKGRRGEVYNVCSGKAIALREVLGTLIREASGNIPISVEVDPAKLRKNDVDIIAGNNGKISKEAGWATRIPINQTLHDVVSYWRERKRFR